MKSLAKEIADKLQQLKDLRKAAPKHYKLAQKMNKAKRQKELIEYWEKFWKAVPKS